MNSFPGQRSEPPLIGRDRNIKPPKCKDFVSKVLRFCGECFVDNIVLRWYSVSRRWIVLRCKGGGGVFG